jgi:oligopeptide/dipeptide ABC transporter ATP-binding protein
MTDMGSDTTRDAHPPVAGERIGSGEDPVIDLPGADTSEPAAPRERDPDEQPLLDVTGLKTHFHTRNGVVQAVDGVDLAVHRGEVLGVVGESGCGKSVTSLSILGLVPYPGRVVEGTVTFEGEELTGRSQQELAELRGDRISMIFQQPTSSLNPVFTAGNQIEEVYELHRDFAGAERAERAVEMLRRVGIPDPSRRAKAYPHELSGGMAQRVMIAMALACEPDLLIADEPTTALDVTIQAQILDLMRDLVDESGTAVVLITHDLGVVAEMADRVAVMYAGQIVEEADVVSLFERPRHPYTAGLIGSMPVLGNLRDELATIPGVVPNLVEPAVGCRFAARCQARIDHDLAICTEQDPQLLPVADGDADQLVRCFLHHDEHGTPRNLMTRADLEAAMSDRGGEDVVATDVAGQGAGQGVGVQAPAPGMGEVGP